MVDLIFDRTQSDVTKLKSLRTKVRNRTATVEEYDEWLTSLKGAYNNTDLNRVGEAINYLGGLLNAYGYFNTATARTDWYVGEKPNPNQMKEYIDNLNELKNCFEVYYSTPQIPKDMINLNIQKANDIEKFLHDIEELIINISRNFIKSGVSNCGQNRLWQQRFRRPIVEYNTWIDLAQETWNDFDETTTWEQIYSKGG